MTSDESELQAVLKRENIVVISVSYGVTDHLRSADELKTALTKAFLARCETVDVQYSCIVELTSDIADSHLVRALFDLYSLVKKRGGILICTGYPEEYLDSLTSVGVHGLPGFFLLGTLEAAFDKIPTLGSK